MDPQCLPRLHLVTDRRRCAGRDLREVVVAAVEGGVGAVHLREKDLPARELLRLARELLSLVRPRGALLLVNDRLDVAMAAGADGVELPAAGLPVAEARRLWPGGLIGASVHSPQEASSACDQGADFALLGTIYATGSHPGQAGGGPELLRTAAAAACPLVAIGGINAANAREVMAAGASGIAVITALTLAADVASAARELRRAVEAADYPNPSPALQERGTSAKG